MNASAAIEAIESCRRTILPGLVVVAMALGCQAAVGQPQPADLRFMQDMIHHHAQALEMTALVVDRTDSRAIRLLARRIEITQQDEIAWMRSWLEQNGEHAPASGENEHVDEPEMSADQHANHANTEDRPLMPGMLTDAQMSELAGASGSEFDRLFLEFMIHHHEGALTMVRELLATEGAAQDTVVFAFASEVDADQIAEIRRMQTVLDEIARDHGDG